MTAIAQGEDVDIDQIRNESFGYAEAPSTGKDPGWMADYDSLMEYEERNRPKTGLDQLKDPISLIPGFGSEPHSIYDKHGNLDVSAVKGRDDMTPEERRELWRSRTDPRSRPSPTQGTKEVIAALVNALEATIPSHTSPVRRRGR